MRVDEDLTMEERKMRWRIGEAARRERARGRKVIATSRELRVDGKKWRWLEEEKRWEAENGEERKMRSKRKEKENE